MKHLLLTTIEAVLLGGCVTIQPTEPSTVKALDISIWQAAQTGNIEALKRHLVAGADVNAKDDLSTTPLLYAAGRGHMEIAKLLIAKGADMNERSIGGAKPLYIAVLGGYKEIVELLIENGAYINSKTRMGLTALHEAAGTFFFK